MAENETFENLTHEIDADFGVVYEIQRDKVLYGTTEYWDAQTELVGKEGYLYIYSDYKQNSQEQDVIGIKVGDGETLLSDLTFSDAYTEEQIASILTSISTLISTKMNVSNPTGTGAFSMNRKANTTVGQYSSTLGRNGEASGDCSYAEGVAASASGSASHAEGGGSIASGNYSHAEGSNTHAEGFASHAEGFGTYAYSRAAHAEGRGTKASSENQHVSGKYNVEDANGTYAEIIGNGGSNSDRSNARTLDWSGNEMIKGDLTFNGNTSLTSALGAKADASSVPTKVSDLQNDTGFITSTVNNLSNYYKKTETYTQDEVNSLISAITTLNIVVVQTLPTQDISTTTIYLVPKSTAQTDNVYDEYIYVNNSWELIGTTAVDLSNYYTKTEVDNKLSAKANSTDLATVATSGSYSDLSNKPTIPAAQVNSDWNSSSGVSEILNKPNLATVATSGSYTDLTNKPTIQNWIDVTGTLTAGNTSIVFSNAAITSSSTIELFVDDAYYGVMPTAVSVATGSVTYTFEAQQTDIPMKVRIS